jgi:hypothetical protein
LRVAELTGTISNFATIDKTTSKVSINICYEGKNVNKIFIGRDVLEAMTDSLLGCALVGKIENGDFTDHGEVLIRKNGKWEVDTLTQAYGFVDKDPTLANIRWETIVNEDGESKEYLSCDAYLWTCRYPELIDIFANNKIQQSMEIRVVEGFVDKDDDLLHITEAVFLGLCMLGTAPPAFEDAKVQMYTEMPDAFLQMVEQIKNSFTKEENDKLEIFNHEEFVKQFSLTVNGMRELLQKSISQHFIDGGDEEPSCYVEDFNASYVYTMDRNKRDRFAYKFEMQEGNATIDFENPRKYIMPPMLIDEGTDTEGYQQSTFSLIDEMTGKQAEEFKVAIGKEVDKFNKLQEDFDTVQGELNTTKEKMGELEQKFAEISKSEFSIKAKQIYEGDSLIKQTIPEDEANGIIEKFTESMDLAACEREFNFVFGKKVREDATILQNSRNDGLNHMGLPNGELDDAKDKNKNFDNGSPYPGDEE